MQFASSMALKSLVAAFLAAAALASSQPFAADQAKRGAPVKTGDAAPDFTLADQDGRSHTLSAERGKRPVVLVFYRGYW
jgi:cytochrome oxidase Cu insertion factor (SCO1/SenC/PrrC family)